MALRRKRRRNRERQQRPDQRPTRSSPTDHLRPGDEDWSSLTWLLGAQREPGDAPSTDKGVRKADESPAPIPAASPGLLEAPKVSRLAYTRQQAAEALGVSVSTIDRRLVPSVDTVLTPWGQRLIPVDELERFLREHLKPARGRPARRPAGRPQTLPRSVVERIRLDYARGRSLSEIARALTAEGVPTAHGGRQWWASTVRAILVRPASN